MIKIYNESHEKIILFIKEVAFPHKFKLIFATSLMFVTASATTYMTYLIKPVMNDVFTYKKISSLYWVCIRMAFMTFIKAASIYLQIVLLTYVKEKIALRLKNKVFSKAIKLDMITLHKMTGSKVNNIISGDIANLSETTNYFITSAIRELLTILFLLILLIYQDPILSFFALFTFPLMIGFIKKLSKALKEYMRKANLNRDKNTHVMLEKIRAIKTVKINSFEKHETRIMQKQFFQFFKIAVNMSKKSALSVPLSEFSGSFAVIFVILYGGLKVIHGHSTPGHFFTFLTALLALYRPAKSLSGMNMRINGFLISLERVNDILKQPSTHFTKDGTKVDLEKSDIVFDNIYFKYDRKFNKESADIKGISLNIKSGSKVGIVGKSGSGKSTLIDFIPRLIETNDGSITIGDYNINDIDTADLRRQICYITADTILFSDTVKNNILYGKKNNEYTEDDLKQAIKFANAEFVYDLPNGIDTEISQEFSLSTGQKQRIILARAFFKHYKIALLDEITSALDRDNEAYIKKSVNEFFKGKTTIIIAHKMHLVEDCDIIYVISNGEVVASGTAEELRQNEHFKRLATVEFS